MKARSTITLMVLNAVTFCLFGNNNDVPLNLIKCCVNKKLYTTLFAFILFASGFAQPVVRTQKDLGGNDLDFFTAMALTKDGGRIAGGYSLSNISGQKTENSRGAFDYWIVKLDSTNKIEFDKTIGGSKNDILTALQQTNDGGYILGGWSNSGISGEKTQNQRGISTDYWIVKMDAIHTIEWDRTVGGNRDDYLQHIEQTSKGLYIACGYSWSNRSREKSENTRDGGAAYNDYWVVMLDAKGRYRTDKTIGSVTQDWCVSIKELPKNNFVIGGYTDAGISADKTEPSRGSSDYWLVTLKFNSVGALEIAEPENSKISKRNKSNFSVYPNPVKDILYIQNVGKTTVTLTDQQGKTILTKTINGNEAINVSYLPAGLYYLKSNATGATQKITIAK